MVDRTLDDAEGRSAAAPKAGPDPRRPPAWTDRVPDLLASYLAAVATFCAVTALLPVLREWTNRVMATVVEPRRRRPS